VTAATWRSRSGVKSMRVPPPSLFVARAYSAMPLLRANSTDASWHRPARRLNICRG
jgi:hypothetical protein